MKTTLPLFVFIDACGWEIIKYEPFLQDWAPHRRRLRSVFGYSSACIPSIVSGAWPVEHRNWCYFVYDPAHSPFQHLRPLRWLPRAVTSRRRFRRWLSRLLRRPLKLRGYFDLYNLPFEYLHLFDFTEKKNPLEQGGLNRGANIFDFLQIRGHARLLLRAQELLRFLPGETADFVQPQVGLFIDQVAEPLAGTADPRAPSGPAAIPLGPLDDVGIVYSLKATEAVELSVTVMVGL